MNNSMTPTAKYKNLPEEEIRALEKSRPFQKMMGRGELGVESVFHPCALRAQALCQAWSARASGNSTHRFCANPKIKNRALRRGFEFQLSFVTHYTKSTRPGIGTSPESNLSSFIS